MDHRQWQEHPHAELVTLARGDVVRGDNPEFESEHPEDASNPIHAEGEHCRRHRHEILEEEHSCEHAEALDAAVVEGDGKGDDGEEDGERSDGEATIGWHQIEELEGHTEQGTNSEGRHVPGK